MNGLISMADNHIEFSGSVGGARAVYEGHLHILVGGCMFKLNQLPLYPAGILPAGTPVYCDEEARTFDIHYAFAVAEAATSSTSLKVAKGLEGSRIKVGMHLIPAQNDVATAADATFEVTAVDTSNAAYDTVTLGSAITAAAGDVLWEADSTTKKIKVLPNALTDRDKVRYADTFMVDGAAAFGSDGAVLERRIPPISPAVKAYMRSQDCFFRFSNHK